MALRATLVQAGHGQPGMGFHDFVSVRVVTLDTIHSALDDRMMPRQVKIRVNIEMALKADRRVLARINDELSASAAAFDMFAARPVTRLTAIQSGEFQFVFIKFAVFAERKRPADIRVTFDTGGIADEMCSFDLRRSRRCLLDTRTRDQ
jgi:hypothetical protein